MIYTIEFSEKAETQFKKIDKQIQERISKSLERIKNRPYDFIERLSNSSYFKLRVGDYRVILRIENDKLLILVIKIGHRRNIYKKL